SARLPARSAVRRKRGGASMLARVRQAERDRGMRDGQTTEERQRIKALEREDRELKRANEILRKASAYLAQAEPDRRQKRRWRSSTTIARSTVSSRSARFCRLPRPPIMRPKHAKSIQVCNRHVPNGMNCY